MLPVSVVARPAWSTAAVAPPWTKPQTRHQDERYEPMVIVHQRVADAGFFCGGCACPMEVKIRLDPCFHLICLDCFALMERDPQSKCLVCHSQVTVAMPFTEADHFQVCSGACTPGRQGRAFLNSRSLACHKMLLHSEEGLAEESDAPADVVAGDAAASEAMGIQPTVCTPHPLTSENEDFQQHPITPSEMPVEQAVPQMVPVISSPIAVINSPIQMQTIPMQTRPMHPVLAAMAGNAPATFTDQTATLPVVGQFINQPTPAPQTTASYEVPSMSEGLAAVLGQSENDDLEDLM